jgi:preprotein translocase subunit SecA
LPLLLRDTFGVEMGAVQIQPLLDAALSSLSDIRASKLFVDLKDRLDADLDSKRQAAGEENLGLFIRYQYLQEIDNKWLAHLDNMEALREAVYLRSYAQKNPLLEYKIEGSDIFEKLVDSIRSNIASRVLRVRIKTEQERPAPARMQGPAATAVHESSGQFSAAEEDRSTASAHGDQGEGLSARPRSSSISEASRPDNVTVVRSGDKVGRNDPCPCGSGKKYKHCHGR